MYNNSIRNCSMHGMEHICVCSFPGIWEQTDSCSGSKCFVMNFNFGVDAIVVTLLLFVLFFAALLSWIRFRFGISSLSTLSPSFFFYLLAYTILFFAPVTLISRSAIASFNINWYTFKLLCLHYFMLFSM